MGGVSDWTERHRPVSEIQLEGNEVQRRQIRKWLDDWQSGTPSKKALPIKRLSLKFWLSLKNSLTYMRSGPGKKYPVIFEIRQKGYPLKITAEFNNWRKVITSDKLTGWIHTQLLSSFRTGIILDTSLLKKTPSDKSRTKAKLLPKLIVNIIRCDLKWCKIEIVKEKTHSGWIKKKSVWGALLK